MTKKFYIADEHNMMEHNRYLMQELYEKPCKMANVGVMMSYMDYTPRTMDEICTAMKGVWVR